MNNKLVILTGMPHSGKSTMMRNLRSQLNLVSFQFDAFHGKTKMFKKFPKISAEGSAVIDHACKVTFESVFETSLNVLIEGVAFMSKDILNVFINRSNACEMKYKVFKLVIDYNQWVNQVPENHKERKNRDLWKYWNVYLKDDRMLEIQNSNPIRDFLKEE